MIGYAAVRDYGIDLDTMANSEEDCLQKVGKISMLMHDWHCEHPIKEIKRMLILGGEHEQGILISIKKLEALPVPVAGHEFYGMWCEAMTAKSLLKIMMGME